MYIGAGRSFANLVRVSVILFSILLGTVRADAALLTLPTLTTAQTDPIFKVLASAAVFRSMEPASSPAIWGLWFNARVNGTSSTLISSIANTGNSLIPFADLQFGVSGPLGLGLEFSYLPSYSFSGTTFGSFGVAARWTMTQTILKMLPFDAALRFIYSNANLTYSQVLSGANIVVNYGTAITGSTLMISKKLLIFEPYISYGLMSHSSTLTGTGTVSLFGTGFPIGTSSTTGSGISGWFQAGIEIKLVILTLGAQYDNAWGSDTYSGKVGFKF